jgi:hypothetical protein
MRERATKQVAAAHYSDRRTFGTKIIEVRNDALHDVFLQLSIQLRKQIRGRQFGREVKGNRTQ